MTIAIDTRFDFHLEHTTDVLLQFEAAMIRARLSPRNTMPTTTNQTDAILAHLQEGKSLTSLQALRLFGCNRLAARIRDLKDAGHPFEKQDLQLADLIEREGRALVIAVNKWDLIEDKQKKLVELREECERLLPQLRGVPLVTISGLQGRNIDRLMQAVFAAVAGHRLKPASGTSHRRAADLCAHVLGTVDLQHRDVVDAAVDGPPLLADDVGDRDALVGGGGRDP